MSQKMWVNNVRKILTWVLITAGVIIILAAFRLWILLYLAD